jgi:hypothetical protein
MFAVFCEWNSSESGVLSEEEMGSALGWSGEPLERRVFALLSDSKRGVSFRSFLVRLWSWLASDWRSLAYFAFQLYDVSESGVLGVADIRLMLLVAFGPTFEGNHQAQGLLARLVERDFAGRATSASLRLDSFIDLVSHAQMLLAPVFYLQNKMQGATLGVRGWASASAARQRGLLRGTFDICSAAVAANAALGYNMPLARGAKVGAAAAMRAEADAKLAQRRRLSGNPPHLVAATERHLLPQHMLRGAAPNVEIEGFINGPRRSRLVALDHPFIKSDNDKPPSLIAVGLGVVAGALTRSVVILEQSAVGRQITSSTAALNAWAKSVTTRSVASSVSPLTGSEMTVHDGTVGGGAAGGGGLGGGALVDESW